MISLKIWEYVRVVIQIFVQMLVVFFKLSTGASDNFIQKIQDLNLFLNTDLENEQNLNGILKISDSFVFNLVDFL